MIKIKELRNKNKRIKELKDKDELRNRNKRIRRIIR